jgi:hypothetical protein
MTEVHAGFWCGQLRKRDQMKDLGVDGKIVLNVMRRHELD